MALTDAVALARLAAGMEDDREHVQSSRSPGEPPSRWILALATLAAGLSMAVPIAPDPDLWGHTFYGREVWTRGALPKHNGLAYTVPDYPWINHEWLFEVQMYLAHRAAGAVGLSALHLLWLVPVVVCALVLLWRRCAPLLVWLFCLLVLLPCVDYGRHLRPQLATFALSAVVLLILDRVWDAGARLWPLYVLPVLMAFWVNLHGGFLVSFCLLGLFLVAVGGRWIACREARQRDRGVLIHGVIAFVLCVGASLVNPYGYRLWGWLYTSLSQPRPEILEWQSPFRHWELPNVPLFVLILAGVAGLLVWQRGLRFTFATAAWLGCSVMACLHLRHISLVMLTTVAVLARAAGPLHDCLAQHVRVQRLGRGLLVMLAFLGLSAALSAGKFLILKGTAIEVSPRKQPVAAVRFMQANQVQGNLACFFNWAQYCLWHLYPQCRIAFDGRFRAAYPESVLQAGFALHFGRSHWDRLLREYDTTLVLLHRDNPGTRHMRAATGWVVVHEDATAVLFAKRDQRNAVLLARHQGHTLAQPEPLQESRWP